MKKNASICIAYAMAQRVLDMAAGQPIHTGVARDEARKQFSTAFNEEIV